jgi:hypothetical protein
MAKHPDKEMNHQFTLILSGVAEITPELADGLYEATGGDIEFNMTNGVAYLEFERSVPSLDQAITSAITQVDGAELGVRVVRVESDSANTIEKINASLLGVTVEI